MSASTRRRTSSGCAAGRQCRGLFAAGKTDAFLGFPPEPQELRDRGFNRVILNTHHRQALVSVLLLHGVGNRAWVRDHPVATKRFLRAVFKAAEFCSAEPEVAARRLVDGGFTDRYDYGLETIRRAALPRLARVGFEDSMRFYALRLREVGMISSTPQEIIAEGTDWRFLDELKRELKG